MSKLIGPRRPGAAPGLPGYLMELDSRLAALAPSANPMAISQVDGFAVATLISPACPDFADWLPVVWGGAPGQDCSVQGVEEIANCVDQHTKRLETALREDRFEPILDVGDDGRPDWRLWAVGFGVALALYPEDWDVFAHDEDCRPIYRDLRDLSRYAFGLGGFAEDRAAELERHAEAVIRDGVQVLYDKVVAIQAEEILAGIALRPELALPEAPLRLGPKIGRNEPCPCGSGKKYKKCCGA